MTASKPSKNKAKKLLNLVFMHYNKISFLLYLAGVGWFCALMDPNFNGRCYFSENALLPGLTDSYFYDTGESINNYNRRIYITKQSESRMNRISEILQENDFEFYEQTFNFKNKIFNNPENEFVNGTNVYAFIRGRRASSTDSIIINIPIPRREEKLKNYAAGKIIALAKQMKNQVYWAKDVIILFSEHGTKGANAWISSYNGHHYQQDMFSYQPLQSRAGSLQAGIVLEFMNKTANLINVKVEGLNGQLPNLDLFNLAVRLGRHERVHVTVNNMLSPARGGDQLDNWKKYFETAWRMMKFQFVGRSTGNHGVFLKHKVETLTLEGIRNKKYSNIDLVRSGRVVEGMCRSLNNLMERLHQSFFFYLLPSTERYISIGLYMPPLGLILAAPLLQVLCMHFADLFKPFSDDDKDDGDIVSEDESCEDNVAGDGVAEVGDKKASTPVQEAQVLPTLDLYDVDNFIGVWTEVATVLTFCFFNGVIVHYVPEMISRFNLSSLFYFDSKFLFLFLTLAAHIVAVTVGTSRRFKHATSCKRAHECGMIFLTVSLGIVSIVNYSFGLLLSIFVVPPILLVGGTRDSTSRNVKRFAAGVFMLIAPLSIICFISLYLNNGGFSITGLADVVTDIYENDRLNGVWTYRFATLIYFPFWLKLFLISVLNIDATSS